MGLGAQRLAILPTRWLKDLWKARASSRGTVDVLGNEIRSVDLSLWPIVVGATLWGRRASCCRDECQSDGLTVDILCAVIIAAAHASEPQKRKKLSKRGGGGESESTSQPVQIIRTTKCPQ